MAAVKIFQVLRDKVQKNKAMLPAERRAMFWFQEYATALAQWQSRFQRERFVTLQKRTFTKQLVGANRAQPGFFYFYVYDPKWKDELPYYDKFPFVLVLHTSKDRFLGLNFHYLDYKSRARLFDLMYQFRDGRPSRPTVRDIRMRLRVSYLLLKASSKYKAFKPCIKEYLIGHVRTPLMKVGAKEWDIALFLPVEQFEKKTKQFVWKESRKQF
jgi:hypothetical protein